MPTLLTSSNSVYAGHADHADNDDDSATWAEIMGAIGAEADVKASGQVTEPLRKKQCRLLNEMEEKAKEYEEEAIAREERLMMQVEDHRGNQREERRYLATERTLRMPGYVAKGM